MPLEEALRLIGGVMWPESREESVLGQFKVSAEPDEGRDLVRILNSAMEVREEGKIS